MIRCLLGLLLLLPMLTFADSPMSLSSTLEVRTQGSSWQKQTDSLLNPNNAIARLPASQFLTEALGQVQGRSERFDFTMRGIAIKQHTNVAPNPGNDAYLSQAFARLRFGSRTTVSTGRLLLTWGPGQLRSPSNPFYFDAGKTQPLRELSGIDAGSMLYSGDNASMQVARVFSNGHTSGIQGENFSGNQGENFSGNQTGSMDFRGTTLFKLDAQGDNWQNSLVLAKKDANPLFVGGYGQWTANDAVLLYAEVGSGSRPQSLLPDSYHLIAPSPRATTTLLGGSYTLENGQTIYGEFLYDGHGYNRNEERTYFAVAQQAASQLVLDQSVAARLGQALGTAPVMLGRRYVSAIWRSNPQESGSFWQGMWTTNVNDYSQLVSVYVEQNLTSRVTVFGYLTRNFGGRDTEFGALFKGSVLLGVKIFAM